MRLLAVLGLAAMVGSGCISVVDLATDETEASFESTYTEDATKGKKIAVVGLRVATGLSRDRWFRRKLSAAVEGLVIGAIPVPWDLRAWYGPAEIDAGATFAADTVDDQLGDALVESLKTMEADAVRLDAASAKGVGGRIAMKKLLAMAKAGGAEALYVVIYNGFKKLRFKHDEDKQGEEMFHEIYQLEGQVYIPSTAVFGTDGKRLLARARQHETIFYTPLLTWGWMTPFHDDDDFKDTLEFLGEISGSDAREASTKMARYVVKRDFGGEEPAEEPTDDATDEKEARLREPAVSGRG